MLGGTGDSTCNVELRCDDLAGLADLMGSGYPAFLDRRSCGTYNASHDICKFFNKGKVLLASHSSSAGYNDLGLLEVDALSDLLDGLNDLCADCIGCYILRDDFTCPALIQLFCEGSGTDCGNMRKILTHLHII